MPGLRRFLFLLGLMAPVLVGADDSRGASASLEMDASGGDVEAIFNLAADLTDCLLFGSIADGHAVSEAARSRLEQVNDLCGEDPSLQTVLHWASIAADQGHVGAGSLYAYVGMQGYFSTVFGNPGPTTEELAQYLRQSETYLRRGQQAGDVQSFELYALRSASGFGGAPDYVEALANLLVVQTLMPSKGNAFEHLNHLTDGQVLSDEEVYEARRLAESMLRTCCD